MKFTILTKQSELTYSLSGQDKSCSHLTTTWPSGIGMGCKIKTLES